MNSRSLRLTFALECAAAVDPGSLLRACGTLPDSVEAVCAKATLPPAAIPSIAAAAMLERIHLGVISVSCR
ncbi:MAG: hypothetical protein ACREU3_02285 [Steroidobacteraceae bacterium]